MKLVRAILLFASLVLATCVDPEQQLASRGNVSRELSIASFFCWLVNLISFGTIDTCDDDSTDDVCELPTTKPPPGTNVCEGEDPNFGAISCLDANVREQSGVNVTEGYQGDFDTDVNPILTPFYTAGLCPVNVHWHLGAEHYSQGEYDESGSGPTEIDTRRRLAGKVRQGYQCQLYDPQQEMFTKPYDWKHCIDMEVGQTYEVHWPHSDIGACGTPNQYQTPFADGVFCKGIGLITATHMQIGVQAQVFTVVNDESYYYPDVIRGMIVDGDLGADIAKYTGSTTGTSVNNQDCSSYAPISWHVDRKCHLLSASAFDKMCADMKAQRDDMSDDLYAHGSRELVADFIAANNQHLLRRD